MKKIILTLVVSSLSLLSVAQEHVSGYYRKNGTYVQPYQRTYANNTRLDNYSTHPNINPHTGKMGTIRVSSLPSTNNNSIKYSTPITLPTSTYRVPKAPKMTPVFYR